MRRALVIGASGGIGSALAEALDRQGAEVIRLSRSADGLDVTDEALVECALGRLEPPFDRILVATGALSPARDAPEKRIAEVTPEGLRAAFDANAVGPMLVLKHALRLLPKDAPSVFAALSARVGSIGDNGIGGWHSYRASKAALNQLLHGAAVELRRTHRHATVLLLHPGTVATPFTAEYAGRHRTVAAEDAAVNLLNVIDGANLEMSGGFYDYAGERIEW